MAETDLKPGVANGARRRLALLALDLERASNPDEREPFTVSSRNAAALAHDLRALLSEPARTPDLRAGMEKAAGIADELDNRWICKPGFQEFALGARAAAEAIRAAAEEVK